MPMYIMPKASPKLDQPLKMSSAHPTGLLAQGLIFLPALGGLPLGSAKYCARNLTHPNSYLSTFLEWFSLTLWSGNGLMVFSSYKSNLSNFSDTFPGVLPKYFSSEWSFARFHLPEDTQFISAFGSQNTVVIVGMDGRYVTVLFVYFYIGNLYFFFVCRIREYNSSLIYVSE